MIAERLSYIFIFLEEEKMKKKILAIAVLAAVMSMTACSSNQGSTTTDSETTTQAEAQAEETQAEETEAAAETDAETEAETEAESAAGTDVFTDENGVLTYLDTANAPFEGAGLKITVDKAAKTVNFVKTDLEGVETVEYYTFDFNSNTVEEYYYVSMMGTGFYYTFDLAANEIVKVEDSEHNDSTQSTKDNGRYDGANDRMKGDVEALRNYFTENYGVSIEDMVK